jgi:hypothetical protein
MVDSGDTSGPIRLVFFLPKELMVEFSEYRE